MNDRFFLDTNIIVYAFNTDESKKQVRAQTLLKQGIRDENIFLSVQVIGELYVVMTQKIKQPLTGDDVTLILHSIEIIPAIEIDLSMVKRAVYTSQRYRISYWDSLIISAAERLECTHILTEDLNPEQYYHKIQIINPFTTDN